ncbi:hotdog family protein [Shewanella sp. D64]|uniref:hotdog family protein n=1 Tax=unclassified Shewanella TaxID=196818 RepID=UPI0022BA4F4A|nr:MULTISPECIES: hotdog family protein [unclassified Shewanella]MEC4726862.1 hotdog family protein [Shewanella sp. D64]MEC4739026.1 hotdog family protein [Shewanella sp. E94]WBJ95886.1 hotdog family protein [Shewanella sp. MTB7]
MTQSQEMSLPEPLSQLPVAEVVPHKDPMILIDELIAYKTDTLITQTNITTLSPYLDDKLNAVPNYVGIEYMAQSVAALAGVEAKLRGDIIRVGFLLGSRKLKMHIPYYQLGESYQTHVTRLYQEESGLAVFECKVFHHQTLVAEANVNVFQPQDTQSYISQRQQEDKK